MSLGFEVPPQQFPPAARCPGGTFENSPRFQPGFNLGRSGISVKPKVEIETLGSGSAGLGLFRWFGFPVSDFFRPSAFGFRISGRGRSTPSAPPRDTRSPRVGEVPHPNPYVKL